MGNTRTSTKYKILTTLRNASSPVSGETIAGETGISRVSVWKAIKALQDSGYEITSGKSGYTLARDVSDSIFPWEFGDEEKLFSYFPVTDSTMTQARAIAEQQDSPLRIVTADLQKNGRGKAGRSWTTTKGSLAFTLITKAQLPLAASHRQVMAAQIALAKVLSAAAGRGFYVRWPNDVWSTDGKVSGILDELSASGGFCRWINEGIGVNLYNKPRIDGTDAVFSGRKRVSRKELLQLFLKEFNKEQQLVTQESSALTDEWNALAMDKGKTLCISGFQGTVTFSGINGFGWANVVTGDGRAESLPPGTISFIKKQNK